MKKIVTLIIVAFLANTSVFAEDIGFLYAEGFDSAGESAYEYISSNASISLSDKVNAGEKLINIEDTDGSQSLKLTGYTSEEETGTATRSVYFDFENAYNSENYPNTKLVIYYTEYIENAASNLSDHVIIEGNNGKKMCQILWTANEGKGPKERCNGNTVGKDVDLNKRIESIYIVDFENETFDYILDGTRYEDVSFRQTGVDSIKRIAFKITKNQIFSVDNIAAVVIPDDHVLTAEALSFDGKNNISVENRSFNIDINSISCSNSLNSINVYAEDVLVDKSEYSVKQNISNDNKITLSINFNNDLEYSTKYKIVVGSDFADCMGNLIGSAKEFSFTTGKKLSVEFEKFTSKAGIFGNGADINSLESLKGKYAVFYILMSSEFKSSKDGKCVIEATDNLGNIINNICVDYQFGTGKYEMKYGFYISDNIKEIKVYATNMDGEKISDVVIFPT